MNYEQYIKYAERVSLNSNENTKIGCLLLDDNIIEGFSWNIFKDILIHAEINMIFTCTKAGISMYGKTIVLNHYPPCLECSYALYNVGIKKVVYSCNDIPLRWEQSCKVGVEYLNMKNIKVINIQK